MIPYSWLLTLTLPEKNLIPFRYEAKVLPGIWAAAPYLHNGSVASLDELLKPADKRKKSFQVGPAYDTHTAGLAKRQPQGKRYLRTTTGCGNLESGNSNCGHESALRCYPEAYRKFLKFVQVIDLYANIRVQPSREAKNLVERDMQ